MTLHPFTHLLRAFAPSRSPSTSPHHALSGQQEGCILAEWAVSGSQARLYWAVAEQCHSQRSDCYSTHGPQFSSLGRWTWHSPARTSRGEQSMAWGLTTWQKRKEAWSQWPGFEEPSRVWTQALCSLTSAEKRRPPFQPHSSPWLCPWAWRKTQLFPASLSPSKQSWRKV